MKLWQATNPTARDFRLESVGPIYTSTDLSPQSNGTYVGYCPPPAQGGPPTSSRRISAPRPYDLIRVTPDIDPYDGMGCWE